MEKFYTIPSFPDYEISNLSRCRTNQRHIRFTHAKTGKEHFRLTECKFLKVQYNRRTGYKFHQLYKNKKMFNKNIHVLVGEVFLPNPNNLPEINHEDGNKHNNLPSNLKRCTNEYNHEHATRTGLKAKGERIKTSKLNDNMVHAIKWFLSKGFSHVEISKAFIISRPTISLISEGRIWKHIAITGEEITVNL